MQWVSENQTSSNIEEHTCCSLIQSISYLIVAGGLWPSYTGEVFGPRDDVFLVPQRVYSSMGTLADQITYPQLVKKQDRTKEQEEKMMELMTLVGIQYLVDREGGWDSVRVWEGAHPLVLVLTVAIRTEPHVNSHRQL